MAYDKFYPYWKDLPDKTTPLIGAALTHMEQGIADAMPRDELSKASVGLGNADNTRDLDKQISNPTQNALTAISASVAGKYALPAGGIPKADLAVVVQAAIEKAVSSVQPTDLAAAVAALQVNAPGALDTFYELAAAIGNDPDFKNTILNAIASKAADNAVVKLTGAQTVGGLKNYADGLQSGGKAVVVNDDSRLSNARTPTTHTHDPEEIDGLADEFSLLYQQLAAVAPAPVTRTLTYTNGGMGGGGAYPTPSSGTITQLGLRHVVHIPIATTRWRIKLRNYVVATGSNGAAALTGQGIVFGEHAPNSVGENTGNFKGGTASTIVSGTFSVPNTTDFYMSPWVTDPALQFRPDKTFVVGWGFTCAAQQLQGGVNEAFQLSTSAAGLNSATTGGSSGAGSTYKGTPIDFQIEFESTSTKKAFLLIGDSIAEGGVGVKGTVYTTTVRPCPIYRSYPHRWAEQHGHLMQSIAQFNTTTADWANTSGDRWTRTDMSNAKFDGAFIALGSNDMSTAGLSLATYQTNMATIVAKVRSIIGDDKPIYGVEIMGRNYSAQTTAMTTTMINARQAFNEWLATVPLGLTDVVSMESSMTTAGSSTLNPTLTCDGIHPSFSGISVMAAQLGAAIPG